jgi:hypothetical protein
MRGDSVKKFEWQGGESRYTSGAIVDWMMISEDGKELIYVESEWIDKTEEGEVEEQLRVFWDCLEQIADKAEEIGFELSELSGLDFEHYGNPNEHFENINDVPIYLRKYLKKYF